MIIIPVRVLSIDYDEHGKPYQTSTVVVDKALLKVNTKLEDSLFTIPIGPEDHVFDDDLGAYVRTPSDARPLKSIINDVVVDTYIPPALESKRDPLTQTKLNIGPTEPSGKGPSAHAGGIPAAIWPIMGTLVGVAGALVVLMLLRRKRG